MVPAAGLEPARLLSRGILSPLCLPIPPSGLSDVYLAYLSIINVLASRAFNWLLLLLQNELCTHYLREIFKVQNGIYSCLPLDAHNLYCR